MHRLSDPLDAVLALPLPAAVVAACEALHAQAQAAAEALLAQADALLATVRAFALVSLTALAGC